MKIKILYPNEQGKLEFSKVELEKLLTEAYNEGYADGQKVTIYTGSYPYSNNPSWTYNNDHTLCSTSSLTNKSKVDVNSALTTDDISTLLAEECKNEI